MRLPKIAVILVNHNNPIDTKKAINSIENKVHKGCEVKIFVTNNGCNDGESELLDLDCPNIKLINSPQNLGFGGGNNLAAKSAITQKCDYLLFLNNDAEIITEDFFSKIIESPYSITAPVLENKINSKEVLDFGGKVDWVFGRNTHLANHSSADYYSGACLFMKSDVFTNLSGFDEKFFLYYEDADFCLRASSLGYSLGINPLLRVRHRLSASTNKLGSKKLKYLSQSHLLFCQKHLSVASYPFYKLFSLYLISKRILPFLAWKVQDIWSSTYTIRNNIYCFTRGIKPIHIVGDSHVWPYKNVHPFEIHHFGGVTAYNLNNQNSTTGSLIKLNSTLLELSKRKHIVLFSFGEIDCRLHIYNQFRKKQQKVTLKRLISDTVSNYMSVLVKLKKLGWSVSVLSPTPSGSERNIYKMKFFADFKTRSAITKQFHLKLKSESKINGIPYIDVYSKVATRQGGIKSTFKEDAVHLNHKVVPITFSLIQNSIYNNNGE